MLVDSKGAYLRRYIDEELDELLPGLPAVAIDGAKAVGKTETALRRVEHVFRLDTAEGRALFLANPDGAVNQDASVLIDEWQHYPESWDLVRRAVDARLPGVRFLTGSATPLAGVDTHSGAGRIVSFRMRPLALSERASTSPSIFIRDLFLGTADVSGETDFSLEQYAQEICSSGFPGIQGMTPRQQRTQIDSYIQRILDRDIPEAGLKVRKPQTLLAWLQAYAAATGTTATYSEILDAATAGVSDKPSKSATESYRNILTKLWILDALPAWYPTFSPFTRLKKSPKHYLLDPALSARLMGMDASRLLDSRGGGMKAFGHLFEALAVLTVRGAAQAAEAQTFHFQTQTKKKPTATQDDGSREVDIIAEDYTGKVLAFEVKLKAHVDEVDVRHLMWLRDKLGERLQDCVVLTAGRHAYRRPDGIAVIPLAMLG